MAIKDVDEIASEQKHSHNWPEDEKSFLSRWFFSYMDPLLSKGAQKTLTHDDLWNLPSTLNSPMLLKKFK